MKRKDFLAASILSGIGLTTSAYAKAIPTSTSGFERGPLKPFYLPPLAEPMKTGPAGMIGKVRVRSNQTNVQFSCMEGIIDPKIMGPAPHVHKDLDEIMFVQEGVVSVMVGSTVYEVAAGGWHLRPHGIIHTYWNSSDKPARFIDMYFNQDFENFLEEMFDRLMPDLMKRGVPLDSKEATEKMNKLYTHYGITMFDNQRQPLMDKYGLK